jgi:hypothetical protein
MKTILEYLGFEVLTAVVIKSSIFWDIMPCIPGKLISSWYLLHAGFLIGLIFDPDDGGDMLLRNIGLLQLTT